MTRRATEVLRYAHRLGYEHQGLTRGGHHRLWHPTAGLVFLASTPGRTSLGNAKSMLRRLARRRPNHDAEEETRR